MKSASFLRRLALSLILLAGLLHGQQGGRLLFTDTTIHTVSIQLNQPHFWDTLVAFHSRIFDSTGSATGPKLYLPATVTIDGTALDSVGVRMKGYSSFFMVYGLKKSFKVDFNKFIHGQKYDGLKSINLHNSALDPTFMRDKLAYELLTSLGIAAPRTTYVKLFINNKYWGLYYAVEEIDDQFLTDHFQTGDGNLFQCIGWSNLSWQGENYTAYQDEMELDGKQSCAETWSGFIRFIRLINNPTTTHWADSLHNYFAVSDYLKILAFDIFSSNWDSYMYNGRNFYLYEYGPQRQIHWIPWDYNFAFSPVEFSILPKTSEQASSSMAETDCRCTNGDKRFCMAHAARRHDSTKVLTHNILSCPQFRNAYLDSACKLLLTAINVTAFNHQVDRYRNLIATAVDQDSNKQFSSIAFTTNCERDTTVWYKRARWDSTSQDTIFDYLPHRSKGLKQFFRERKNALLQQIEKLPYTCKATDLVTPGNSPPSETVTINIEQSCGRIRFHSARTLKRVRFYTLQGRMVIDIPLKQNQQHEWLVTATLNPLSDGVYCAMVETVSGYAQQFKIILRGSTAGVGPLHPLK
ncbi:MAG: CotH kinase family protein [Chitinivibrionales bacterium]|nr:CotH kinase family protein [Chitinivibrionales bacterium]